MTANFEAYRTIILETFRKSGEAVPTPIWFVQEGDTLYMRTSPNAGKIKRIRNNSHVRIAGADAAENPIPPYIDGTARIIDGDEAKRIYDQLDARYGGYFKRSDGANPFERRNILVFAVDLAGEG